MPSICPPFDFTGPLVVPTTEQDCATLGHIAFSNFNQSFETFKCTEDFTGANTEDNRKRCTIAGTPIFEEDYETMSKNAQAITVSFPLLPCILLHFDFAFTREHAAG